MYPYIGNPFLSGGGARSTYYRGNIETVSFLSQKCQKAVEMIISEINKQMLNLSFQSQTREMSAIYYAEHLSRMIGPVVSYSMTTISSTLSKLSWRKIDEVVEYIYGRCYPKQSVECLRSAQLIERIFYDYIQPLKQKKTMKSPNSNQANVHCQPNQQMANSSLWTAAYPLIPNQNVPHQTQQQAFTQPQNPGQPINLHHIGPSNGIQPWHPQRNLSQNAVHMQDEPNRFQSTARATMYPRSAPYQVNRIVSSSWTSYASVPNQARDSPNMNQSNYEPLVQMHRVIESSPTQYPGNHTIAPHSRSEHRLAQSKT